MLEPRADYWDDLAASKVFTHPLRGDWLSQHGVGVVDRRGAAPAWIVDAGCGQGRLWSELRGTPWHSLGLDRSRGMLMQARERNGPGTRLAQAAGCQWPLAGQSVDGVLLVSVLTCLLADADQRDLLGEARRCLRPGGLLFASDLTLQSDARNRERYGRGMLRYGRYGCFQLPDGGEFRHMSGAWIAELFADLEPLEFEEHQVLTMNGNPARAFRGLWRKPEA